MNKLDKNKLLLSHSPMQKIQFQGRDFYLKRDDLLHPQFSGNKARKFAYLLEAELPEVKTLIGHGSVQANSLYSLAALAKLRGWQLDYYVQRIPPFLKQAVATQTAKGNYQAALKLGANIVEVKLSKGQNKEQNLDDYMRAKSHSLAEHELFIPEGGRCALAEQGIAQLASEIISDCQKHALNHPIIMLPSGTGTTAVFLQKHLPYEVLTCACVGDASYLEKQFAELQSDKTLWPRILNTEKKYHFGKLYGEFYKIWQELLEQTKIEFELLYDPLGWLSLLTYLQQTNTQQDIIYIHQGGLVGNQSMLPRYRRKWG